MTIQNNRVRPYVLLGFVLFDDVVEKYPAEVQTTNTRAFLVVSRYISIWLNADHKLHRPWTCVDDPPAPIRIILILFPFITVVISVPITQKYHRELGLT